MRIVSFQRAYVVALFSLTGVAMGDDKTEPWNLAELFEAPKWEQTDRRAKPGVKSLPNIETPVIKEQTVTSAYTSDLPIAKAELLYTSGHGAHPERQWKIAPARVSDGKITATVPKDATGLILNVTDNQKSMTSSSYMAIGK